MTRSMRGPGGKGRARRGLRKALWPLLLGAVAMASVGAAGCEGRPKASGATASKTAPALDAPSVVELDLTRGVPEVQPASLFGTTRGRTMPDFVQALRTARERATTKGLFVRLGTANLGMARAQEIGKLLGEARKQGKPVICHADDYGNGTLMLAAQGCSRVWVSPAGGVEAVGIAAELIFGNSLLEKLHVQVDFLQVGKYKGAEEPFTRNGPSPEARQSLEGTLRGLRAAWLQGIAEGRGKPELADVVEDGPFSPEEARAKGLVDEVGYADEARDEAKKLASAEGVTVRFGGSGGPEPASRGVLSVLRALAGSSTSGEPHVAVVAAGGAISMSSAPASPLGGSAGITEHELGRVLSRLASDESTKAVVLRIDSPGGSALASDLLWKKLMKVREEKPLVVSVGGMAASGGYYLACAGSKIVAEPTSILGSIGVVSGKLALGKALAEIGVNTQAIAAAEDPKKAARASYMSPFQGWDEATRERVLTSMRSVYDLFLRRVAEGRGMPVEKVAASAEGRIYGGVEAKERGMIDELGGLSDAIALARELGHLPDDAPVDLVGEPGGLLELLDPGDGGEAGEEGRAAADAAARSAARAATETLLPSSRWPEVDSFVGSFAPLLSGERTVAALPFGLVLR